jgi:hypothetical protein
MLPAAGTRYQAVVRTHQKTPPPKTVLRNVDHAESILSRDDTLLVRYYDLLLNYVIVCLLVVL